MNTQSDVDIDVADRELVLSKIAHTAAALQTSEGRRRHASGVYVTPIPYDPRNNYASIDYIEAEHRGYFKLDILNVGLYQYVRDEQHLQELMREPDWTRLQDREFVEQLSHLANHFTRLQHMPEPIDSIPRLAMFLACIRPAKRHLIGKTWHEVAAVVWQREGNEYTFKKSHSLAYAHLVVVHMNLLASGHALDQSHTAALAASGE